MTTYAQRHWHSHAKHCVESFRKYWADVELRTFDDDQLLASSWLADFKARHKHRPTSNYRFDAVRFAHKIAAIDLAFDAGNSDALIWIDADCITHAPVDTAWLSGLVGDADFAYLRRTRKYPECGFMVFRRDGCRQLISEVVEHYVTDAIFKFPEWHDCFVIEHVRAKLEKEGLCCVSLSGDYEHTGHPLINGPLGSRLDHLKGARKASGKSRAADLARSRDESYWRF